MANDLSTIFTAIIVLAIVAVVAAGAPGPNNTVISPAADFIKAAGDLLAEMAKLVVSPGK